MLGQPDAVHMRRKFTTSVDLASVHDQGLAKDLQAFNHFTPHSRSMRILKKSDVIIEQSLNNTVLDTSWVKNAASTWIRTHDHSPPDPAALFRHPDGSSAFLSNHQAIQILGLPVTLKASCPRNVLWFRSMHTRQMRRTHDSMFRKMLPALGI